MALANVCWGLFALPESLPPEKRTAFFVEERQSARRSQAPAFASDARRLAASFFLMNLAHVVLPSTTVLYLHLSIRVERAQWRFARRRRRFLAPRAGISGQARGAMAQGARALAVGLACGRRLCDL